MKLSALERNCVSDSKGVCLSNDSHPSLSSFKKFLFVDSKKVNSLFTKEMSFGKELSISIVQVGIEGLLLFFVKLGKGNEQNGYGFYLNRSGQLRK